MLCNSSKNFIKDDTLSVHVHTSPLSCRTLNVAVQLCGANLMPVSTRLTVPASLTLNTST
eukprot:3902521-Amphidinium_carterae.1